MSDFKQPTTPIQIPIRKTSNFPKILIVILAIVAGVVILISVYIITNLNNLEANPQSNEIITPEDDEAEEIPEESTSDKFFYIQENNIFSYDLESNDSKQLTNYLKEESSGGELGYIQYSQIIDNKNLGFSRCKGNDVIDCKILNLNLSTNELTELYTLEPQQRVWQLAFYSADAFAFLARSDNEWKLYHIKDGKSLLLEDIVPMEIGRGVGYGDSFELEFSKDGKYLFQISTASGRDLYDFNTYLYDLEDNTRVILEHAISPLWLDSNRILFRNIELENGSFKEIEDVKIYNALTMKTEELTKISYPEVFMSFNGKSLVYNKLNLQEIFTYNFDTNTHNLILSNASNPNWVNATQFVYYGTQDCSDCYGPFETNSLNIYDISTSTSKKLNLDDSKVNGIIPKYII